MVAAAPPQPARGALGLLLEPRHPGDRQGGGAARGRAEAEQLRHDLLHQVSTARRAARRLEGRTACTAARRRAGCGGHCRRACTAPPAPLPPGDPRSVPTSSQNPKRSRVCGPCLVGRLCRSLGLTSTRTPLQYALEAESSSSAYFPRPAARHRDRGPRGHARCLSPPRPPAPGCTVITTQGLQRI